MLAVGAFLGVLGGIATTYDLAQQAFPPSLQRYAVLTMMVGFAVALWVLGTAKSPPSLDVLYREYIELRRKSEAQEAQLAKAIRMLGQQFQLIKGAVAGLGDVTSGQARSAELIAALAEGNVRFQEEIMRMRPPPRKLATNDKDAISAAASRLLAEHIQSYESFGTPWEIDADGKPIRLCIAIATIGGETETVNYRQDIREAFQPTFVVQLEVWTPGLPGNEMFTNAVTVLESETPTNKIRPIVVEALRAGGIEPLTVSLRMMPPRQNREVFGVQVPGTGSNYYPAVYIVVGPQ